MAFFVEIFSSKTHWRYKQCLRIGKLLMNGWRNFYHLKLRQRPIPKVLNRQQLSQNRNETGVA